MDGFDYTVEIKKRSRAPADFPDDEYTLGRFYMTEEFVTNIISQELLKEIVGDKVVTIINGAG